MAFRSPSIFRVASLVTLISGQAYAQDSTTPAAAQPPPPSKTALIYPFAVAAQPRPPIPTPSDDACPKPTPAQTDHAPLTPSTAPPPNPKLLDAISRELQARLAKKMTVQIVTSPATPVSDITTAAVPALPTRALIVAGCLTKIEAGNAAERMAGMGLGASYLNAHIRILFQALGPPTLLQEFDVEIKGSNLLPPLGPVGLITHAASESHQTLDGDAKKLADEVLKKFSKLEKETHKKAE